MSTKLAQETSGLGKGSHSELNIDLLEKERGYFAQTFMVLGIFVLLLTAYSVCQLTLVSVVGLLRIFFLLCFITLLIPHRYTGKRLGMGMFEWFLFNVLAVGPWSFALIMWGNFFLHGEVESRVYPLNEIRRVSTNEYASEVTDGWIEYHDALEFFFVGEDEIGSRVRIDKATGIFGMPVVLKKTIQP